MRQGKKQCNVRHHTIWHCFTRSPKETWLVHGTFLEELRGDTAPWSTLLGQEWKNLPSQVVSILHEPKFTPWRTKSPALPFCFIHSLGGLAGSSKRFVSKPACVYVYLFECVYMCTCLSVCICMYLHAYMYAFEYMYVMYVFELM